MKYTLFALKLLVKAWNSLRIFESVCRLGLQERAYFFPFQIVFEGEKGEGQVALDEITLHTVSCDILQPTEDSNQKSKTSKQIQVQFPSSAVVEHAALSLFFFSLSVLLFM